MPSQISKVISTENGTEDRTEDVMIGNIIESGIKNRIEDKKGSRIRRKQIRK